MNRFKVGSFYKSEFFGLIMYVGEEGGLHWWKFLNIDAKMRPVGQPERFPCSFTNSSQPDEVPSIKTRTLEVLYGK